ncbi:MAG: radical SAM protein [Deltaproteobacteria bacterium]|nr:radical SAM protein [Deltaproteobacteria bacterium]
MKKAISKSIDLVLVVPYQEISAFGARLIDSYLREMGKEVITVFFKKRSQEKSYPTKKEISLLVDFIKEAHPLAVGFSVMSPFNVVARTLTSEIRRRINVPIIWGGVHPTVCPEECIDFADICCMGDGEVPLLRILDSLSESGKIDLTASNCWIRNNGKVLRNPIRYVCTDLDGLPYADLSGRGKYFIDDNRIMKEDPYVTYILTRNKYDFKAFRGCPFTCTYCGNKAIWDVYKEAGNYIRKRSVDNVIGELKEAVKRFPNINKFHSYDEVFTMDRKYVKDFSEKYEAVFNLPFSCDTHLKVLTGETVYSLAQAGLKEVSVGIEAFSETVRASVYNRKMSNQEIIKQARMLCEYGVRVDYDFIYDNPLETESDIAECFWDLIIQLPRPCKFNNYSLSHLPKTELTQRFLDQGLIKKEDIVGASEKGLVQWKATTNYQRDKGVVFWMVVFSLYAFSIEHGDRQYVIPLWVIRFIARSRSFVLAMLCQRIATAVKWCADGTVLINVAKKMGSILK